MNMNRKQDQNRRFASNIEAYYGMQLWLVGVEGIDYRGTTENADVLTSVYLYRGYTVVLSYSETHISGLELSMGLGEINAPFLVFGKKNRVSDTLFELDYKRILRSIERNSKRISALVVRDKPVRRDKALKAFLTRSHLKHANYTSKVDLMLSSIKSTSWENTHRYRKAVYQALMERKPKSMSGSLMFYDAQ